MAKTYDSDMRQKLQRFKFAHNHSDTAYFTALFHTIIQESGIKTPTEALIVCPPISIKDRIFRGPNHAKKLATIFANILGTPHVLCPFRKRFFAGHQSLRKKGERKRVQSEYSLKNNQQKIFQDKDVFLVDDIITTGYTAHTLGKLLKHSGATRTIGFFLSSKKV